MPPVQRSTRINLQDFKGKFLKILGPAKENQYWSLLMSFLSFKLTKAELDKLVLTTIGKENVVLHNQLVRAIYFNATCSDAPVPPPSVHDTSKPVKGIRRKPLVAPASVSTDDPPPVSPVPVVRANGDGAIPSSPRKGRSAINRDRKAKASPLGFHHRGEASTSQGGSALDEETPRSLENGGLKMPDLSRPAQQSPYPAEHSNLELTSPNKRQRVAHAAPGNNNASSQVGDGNSGMGGMSQQPKEQVEEIEQNDDDDDDEDDDEDNENEATLLSNRFIKPPLGIPFCIASVGAPRRVPFMGLVGPLTHTLLGDGLDDECSEGSDDLPDDNGMQRRMNQIAVAENNLGGVSIEAANLLNRALDVYLKRLIKPAIELGRARRFSKAREKKFASMENGAAGYQGKELRKDGTTSAATPTHKQINGAWPVHHISQRGDGATAVPGESAASVEDSEKYGSSSVVSALDLKVAMEVNPHLVGEEWPTLMEKISLRVFD